MADQKLNLKINLGEIQKFQTTDPIWQTEII